MSETVTVTLKNMWFAPTSAWQKSKLQSMSGRRFKPGTYTWPKSVVPYLPKTAIIAGDEVAGEEDPFEPETFSGMAPEDERYDLDLGRAEADETLRVEQKAEESNQLTKSKEEILAERQANLRKANAALAEKREAKAAAERQQAEPEASGDPAVEGIDDEVEF